MSLQDICRFTVRGILRRIIDVEHPELKKPSPPWKRVKKKNLHTLVIPIFNSNSDGEEEQETRRETSSADDSQQFLMDVGNVNTCRSIMEWRQILQGTSAQLLGAIEARYSHGRNSGRSSPAEGKTRQHESMEEDSNFVIPPEDTSESNLFEEMSDEEFLSDVEELQTILRRDDTPSRENNQMEESVESSDPVQVHVQSKSKREKIDSGIVDDIEADPVSGDSDSENDNEESSRLDRYLYPLLENVSPFSKCSHSNVEEVKDEGKSKKLQSHEDATPAQIVNYTTYMKEKIELLPLPMTLKYFLHLNREF